MNDPAVPEPVDPVVRLGMRGLANLTNNMNVGGLYVLIAETPTARFPMLAQTLGLALEEGMVCTAIVAASQPEVFLQRVGSFNDFIKPELITAHQLHVFEMQEQFQTTMFRYGAEGFVRELEYFGVPENSYLIIDQADEVLSLHDISQALDQIEVLSKWLAEQRVTALLAFTRVSADDSDTINALMDNLTGISRIGGSRDGLELTFDYWQSSEGTVAAKNYHLTTLDSGLYEATANTPSSAQGQGHANDEIEDEGDSAAKLFVYMDPDLDSLGRQMPGNWQRVDALVGMMHATQASRSSTAILTFQPDTNLRQLAEAVHTLRLGLGHRAHIVVQEKGASLRYQNEALLLRLGCNLVIHKDVATSRFPLLLESLRGQVFSRNVDINFEVALASVTPTRLRGYILPARFAREVDIILDRAETLNIPCAMVIGRPTQDLTMMDILTQINVSRSGDLITADNEFCYLFLTACPQTVLLLTLERLLHRSVETALNDVRFVLQRAEINAELAALSRAASRGTLPDYSSISEAPQPAESPVTEKVEAKPGFKQAALGLQNASPSQIVAAEPISSLLSAWAPNESRTRTAQDPPVKPQPDRPTAAPQARLVPASSTQVFGKREAPRATRSVPPGNSRGTP